MADPVNGSDEADRASRSGRKPGDFVSSLNAASERVSESAEDVEEAAADLARRSGWNSDGGRADAAASTLRDQAARTANEAKSTFVSMAEEARVLLADMVDQQKLTGAEAVAGFAHAAQVAARDLEETSPQMARLIRAAADGADRVAEGIRTRSVSDLVDTLSDFGRRQPAAFLGGAVLAGFVLARFFKSDAHAAGLEASPEPRV